MRTGRPLNAFALQPEEKTKLELMVRRPKTDQRTALRAGIVLDCAEGLSNKAVAAKHKVTVQTVCKWRARFLQGRLSALGDAPRSGQPRKLTDQIVASWDGLNQLPVPKPSHASGPAKHPLDCDWISVCGGRGVLLTQSMICAGFYFAGRAVGIELPLFSWMSFVPVIVASSALPITFAGIGVREYLLLLFVGSAAVAVDQERILAASLLVLALGLLMALLGGLVYLLYRPSVVESVVGVEGASDGGYET